MIIHIYNTVIKQIKKRNFKDILFRIAEIFYGYPLLFISYLVPRNKNKILVGSHTPFNDNSKYFLLLSKKYNSKARIIWIAHTVQIANHVNSLGFESYYRWSVKGVYHSLTAKFYVFCFHVIDINLWTSGNTIKINLWHGIPLKHIEFMAKTGSSASIYNEKNILSRIFALYIFIKPDFLVSSSPAVSNYYKKAFRLTDKNVLLEYGSPRTDIFFLKNNELKTHIEKYESNELKNLVELTERYSKVFIYMPTWRDYDFFVEFNFDFKLLNEKLEKLNMLFLFKLHPATPNPILNENFNNIIVLENTIDMYPLLPFTDCLITDYSSIYYDYLLLNKEILLFPFDYDKYINYDRGFIEDYEKAMPGNKIFDFDSLIESLSKEQYIEKSIFNEIKYQKWSMYDGNATKHLLEHIQND